MWTKPRSIHSFQLEPACSERTASGPWVVTWEMRTDGWVVPCGDAMSGDVVVNQTIGHTVIVSTGGAIIVVKVVDTTRCLGNITLHTEQAN